MTIKSSAVLSRCGYYRYYLQRQWGKEAPMVFCMLNPSTADAETDDPTIRRCIGFAKRENAGGLVVVNLFGLRSTSPKALVAHNDPVGADNDKSIGEGLLLAAVYKTPVICAWGVHAMAQVQAKALIRRAATFGATLRCLGTTKDGSPRHPLYVPADTAFIPYP